MGTVTYFSTLMPVSYVGCFGREGEDTVTALAESRRLRKCDVFGVHVTPTHYDELTRWCVDRAQRGEGGIVDLMPVHGLVSAARGESYRAKMNAFDVVAPDGQPVRWALNHFHGAGLTARVYGPEPTLRV